MKKLVAILSLVFVGCVTTVVDVEESAELKSDYKVAYFAGGCFWCMEPPFDELEGVITTIVGYMGGDVENPTYEIVSTGASGHAEVVEITYDSNVITYEDLLKVYWRNIDPTALNYQFNDYGSQYRTEIFYLNEEQKNSAIRSKEDLEASGKFIDPVVTAVSKAEEFYIAEEYHQDFYMKNNLRYGVYKKASGREVFFKQVWGEPDS
ncbi:MAG: peptide-methionine (S)-S-oxide reductase [Actinobacteria bacterium]|nr:peptide-methionine (S)-S-oxide reductase [Actinomycetota bacterium]